MQVLQMPGRIVTCPMQSIQFVVFGCGGTGGYLVPNLARIIGICNEKYKRNDRILLIDGDKVEPHNLARQNFIAQDVGKNKAEVLAKRYSKAFGVTIEYFPEYLRDSNIGNVIGNGPSKILIGCVDNNKTRHLLHNIYRGFSSVNVYLDSGNEEYAGQVVFSCKNGVTTNGVKLTFSRYSYECIKDVVEYFDLDANDRHPDDLSCAERAVHAPQNIATNIMAANVLFNYCNAILEHHCKLCNVSLSFLSLEATEKFSSVTPISAHITYFNARTGAIRTENFEEQINKLIKENFDNKQEWDKKQMKEEAAVVNS